MGSKGGDFMDRKKWFALATLALSGAAVAIYVAPYARARQALAPRSANAIFRRSWSSLRHTPFSETLSYQNDLLPAVNLDKLVDLPVPGTNVATINLYQQSPQSWRFEEMNSNAAVVGVLARQRNHLVTYQSARDQRTVSVLPSFLRSPWSLWQVPQPGAWARAWRAHVATAWIAGTPAYQVTLTPRESHTLWGSVTYWFQGGSFIPLGIRVDDHAGDVVFQVKAQRMTTGSPGASAALPSAGRLVAWHASPALAQVTRRLAASRASAPVMFPAALGPLREVTSRQAGGNAIAVYGSGPGRVLVLSTPTRVWTGQEGRRFLRPVLGSSRFQGVTDGVFSVVTFREKNREITLMGSRTQIQLARWARSEWQ